MAAPSLPDDKTRFEAELEFVLCLANPRYLNFLAQREYFSDPTFVKFLEYLLYWKKPEYACHLKYPHCLFFLDMLQDSRFRKELARPDFAQFVEEQQLRHWLFYTQLRLPSQP
eukprot:m.71393 g.71393  ORF g.71393 m.71393 type:complete len:113 (+) comp14168_c0_seq1:82-420(+)